MGVAAKGGRGVFLGGSGGPAPSTALLCLGPRTADGPAPCCSRPLTQQEAFVFFQRNYESRKAHDRTRSHRRVERVAAFRR